jgi:hypothetical protein
MIWNLKGQPLSAVHFPSCPPNGQDTMAARAEGSRDSLPNVCVTYTARRGTGASHGAELTVRIEGPILATQIKLRAELARAIAEDAIVPRKDRS